MIKFQNVSKIFKTDVLGREFTALDNVSFNIPEGSMVGFLGANGAGKTTSLKIIMDFIRPTSGTVEFDSVLGANRLEVFKNIGFLPERPYFYPNLKGEEFLTFMGELSEVSRGHIQRETKKWAPRFKIEHALNRELRTYSKGMLQRIGFMATIIHNPRLIILDEPLSGLDPIGRKELKDVIVEVHKEGRTVFFSSHIVPDIEEVCDRVIFLKEGRLVFDGSVNSLIKGQKSSDFVILIQNVDFNITQPLKQYTKLPDNLLKVVVSSDFKDDLIKDSLANNANVIGIEMLKPNLEEIFYQTGRNHDSK